ncbi:MAG: hypothetical protein AAFO69_17580, partial [Bacteroidota bacterium]
MRRVLARNFNRSSIIAHLLMLFMIQTFYLQAQDRDGSIDLTGGDGRQLYMNKDGDGSLGVEGRSFTVEGWVYLVG